jgi:hypothetical protein
MRTSRLIFVWVCLIAFTQLVWSQSQAADQGIQKRGIPGYFNPQTGTFTPKAEPSHVKNAGDAPVTGTPILFRETFVFTISASDVPAGAVIFCDAEIETNDTDGEFYESYEVVATRSGGTATCTVPLLAKWTLVNPTTDMIYARYDAYADQGFSIGGGGSEYTERYSDPPALNLSVPANTQTVTNDVFITM